MLFHFGLLFQPTMALPPDAIRARGKVVVISRIGINGPGINRTHLAGVGVDVALSAVVIKRVAVRGRPVVGLHIGPVLPEVWPDENVSCKS